MIIPSHSGLAISSIVPAIVMGHANEMIPEEVLDSSRVVLLVIDGLGWNQFERNKDTVPCLNSAVSTAITTVAPSTTATALTSRVQGSNTTWLTQLPTLDHWFKDSHIRHFAD